LLRRRDPRTKHRSRAGRGKRAEQSAATEPEFIAPGALLDVLRRGRPGYAAVDVYKQEPIVNGNHPFLSMRPQGRL
jgi:D-3-phosphoglycerate dehydrogenase